MSHYRIAIRGVWMTPTWPSAARIHWHRHGDI